MIQDNSESCASTTARSRPCASASKRKEIKVRLLILIGLLHAAGMCRAQDDSTRLQVSVLNENGEPTAARAWVEANNRRLFTPSDTKSATVYSRDESFSFDGSFIINVPAVTAVLHVEKGKEYLPVDLQLNLKSNEDTTRTVQLKRWIDMPSKGCTRRTCTFISDTTIRGC